MIDPCIDKVTGKPYAWENPEFEPGKHCTSCRFKLCSGAKDFPYTCEDCLPKIRAWKIRSDSAKRAALTRKRAR